MDCAVFGYLALKQLGLTTPVFAVAVTGGAVVVSYLLLSLAFRRIPVAVAFAVWEAVGLILVTGLSTWLFGDHLTPSQWSALAGMAVGARLLQGGTRVGGVA